MEVKQMAKKLNDVVGIIKKITLPTSKNFKIKSGPKKGQDFTIWSIGVQIGNNWYNIKGDSEQKVTDCLKSIQLNRPYNVGDEVKLFLEAEDDAGKYWKIISIVPHTPMDEVPVEEIEEANKGRITQEGILSVVASTGGIKIDEGDWINPNIQAKATQKPAELKMMQGKNVIVVLDDQGKYAEIKLNEDKKEVIMNGEIGIKPEEQKTDWNKKNKRDYRAMAIAYAKDLVIENQIKLDKMKAVAQDIYEFIWEGYVEDLPAKEE